MVGLAVGQSVSQLIIHLSDTKPVSQWVYQFSERNPDTNTDKKKKTKNEDPANFDFNP